MTDEIVKQDTGVVKGNIVGALAYLGGILSAALLLIVEKDNKFVRFHAMQSLIVFIAIMVVVGMLSVIASFFWILFTLIPLIWLLGLVVIIFLIYKAYNGERYKLPLIGDIAEQQIK